jgi:hypothetical protein
VPNVNGILVASSFSDVDDATFADSFFVDEPRLPDPLNATEQILSGLIDHGNVPGVGYAAITGTSVVTFAYTTLE